MARRLGLLLGFVLGDGFVGVDKDHCRNAETGAIEPWALAIVEQLDSYTEISVSGTGVHVICRVRCRRAVDGKPKSRCMTRLATLS